MVVNGTLSHSCLASDCLGSHQWLSAQYHSPLRFLNVMYFLCPSSFLMTAIFNNISWTSHKWVSIPIACVSALTNRKLTAKFLYPAEAAELTVASNRFLIRAIITSGSRPITARQAKIPEMVSK
mmetsp:Transcript_16830/g.35578  ORF Transcript_16830/g.35578 Transcript_16830/m.35578 type:complete len:124 (+) Transcript_16830:509-880(+)